MPKCPCCTFFTKTHKKELMRGNLPGSCKDQWSVRSKLSVSLMQQVVIGGY